MGKQKRGACMADGGIIGSDGMTDAQRAKRNAVLQNLGMSTAPVTQAAPPQVAQPVPQPVQQPGSMIQRAAGILGGRREQIDKASGYANGGIVKGKGTPTSDDVPVKIKGRDYNLSDTEAVLPSKTRQALGEMLGAKPGDVANANKLVEDFIQQTNGKPPVSVEEGSSLSKGGLLDLERDDEALSVAFRQLNKSMAAPGTPQAVSNVAPTTIADIPRPTNQVQVPSGLRRSAPVVVEQPKPAALDPFAYRGGYPADALKGPVNGPDSVLAEPVKPKTITDVVSPTGQQSYRPGSTMDQMLSGSDSYGQSRAGDPSAPAPTPTKPGYNADGVITAESAAAAMGNPMTRSGGIAGSYDGKGVNEILARENKARGEMIDSMIKAQGGNGIAVLPDRTNDANEQLQAMKLTPAEYLAYQQGKARQAALVNEGDARNAVTMRGQDLQAQTEAARLAGNPVDNQIKQNQVAAGTMTNATAKQLQDLQMAYGAEKDPAKRKAIAENIRVMSLKDAASKYLVVPGGEYTDPENPLVKMKSPSRVLDTSTGQFTDAPMGSGKTAPAVDVRPGVAVNAPDGTHTFQGKTIVVKNGKVTEVKNG